MHSRVVHWANSFKAAVVSGLRCEEEAEDAKPRRSKSARRSSEISPTEACGVADV
ncbi:MAG: hypothetical protein KL787_02670 [Taibaiella sp.]|nr:hypothetical protein [Taibaiella sp.]